MLYKQSDAKKVTIQLKIKSEVVSLCTSGKFHVTMFQFLARIFVSVSCSRLGLALFGSLFIKNTFFLLIKSFLFFLLMHYFVIHICEVRSHCFSRLLVHQQREIPLDLYHLSGVSTLFAYNKIVKC